MIAFDLGIKTLATGVNEQGRFYHIGGFKGHQWYNTQIAHRLVASTVVVGDLSQKQMVTKAHQERNKQLHRAVYNDWGLYSFSLMLDYKCRLYGKDLVILDERDTSKTCSQCGQQQAMPLWKRTYRCGICGLVLDRDENSAVNLLQRFLARLGPHTR